MRDYRVVVSIPEGAVSASEAEALFDAVAEAAYGWEPEDRDGWDIEVTATVEDHE